MLKNILAMAIAMAAIALLSSAASAGALSIGDPAPKLGVKRFVKGTPITQFEKGKLYVVEFWATWCGPCKESIPHLTKMAKKNKSVTFIGVSVWEEDQKLVAPFVAKMGAQMDYHVAMDAVPAGGDAHKGKMAMNWMDAAEQDGIPTAFIINKESKVAWIGHPMAMEEPLAKIIAGKWNLKVEAEKARQEVVKAHKIRDLQAAFETAYGSKDYPKAISLLNEAMTIEPALASQLAPIKFTILQEQGKPDEAADYLTKLIAGAFKDDRESLNDIARSQVDPDAPKKAPPVVLAAALQAALRADELAKSKDPVVADTLAAAYFANGKPDKAVETQQRAILLAKGTELEKEPALAQHLAKYKAGK